MKSELSSQAETVLRMVEAGNRGTQQTGYFRKHEEIVEEFDGSNEVVDRALETLLQEGLVRDARPKFERVQGYPLEYVAYTITEQGRNYLAQPKNTSTVFQNIKNSNIAHKSSNVSQTIYLRDLTPDIQKKVKEFDSGASRKDPDAMKSAFGYLADKAVDVAIALGTGALLR